MKPLALLTSDWHFSQVAPAARAAEPSWFDAQKRVIDQLKELQVQFAKTIIVAGDVFDKWYSPSATPELTNFLMDELPECVYSIPGQHDLPDHQWLHQHRSPYGTLVRAGKLHQIFPDIPLLADTGDGGPALVLHGFPWGFPLKPRPDTRVRDEIHLAVVHAYIWRIGHSYKDAPKEQHAECYRAGLEGYDAAVFGDNHQGFMLGTRIINCGTLMRRKTDERIYRPQVGILYEDGHIESQYLDVSKDLWVEESDGPQPAGLQDFDTSGFITTLQSLGPDSLDFHAAVKHYMDQRMVSLNVRAVVLDAVP